MNNNEQQPNPKTALDCWAEQADTRQNERMNAESGAKSDAEANLLHKNHTDQAWIRWLQRWRDRLNGY